MTWMTCWITDKNYSSCNYFVIWLFISVKYHLEIFFVFFIVNRSYVALLLVPRLLLVYQQFTENSAAFVLLIGLELKAAKEVCIIIAIHPLLYTCFT